MNKVSVIQSRETKYCRAIAKYMRDVGHATNAQILENLKLHYPKLSATTVHRATLRLLERGELGQAPADTKGSMRYDSYTALHDHFMCSLCGRLRDVDVVDELRPVLESQIEGCHISGRLTISGICKDCTILKEDV